MAAHAAQAVQVSLLQGLLHWIAVILLVPRGLRLGCGDEQLFFVPQRQPGLPLRIAEGGAIVLQELP